MRRTLFILLFSLIITAVPAASFAQSEDTPVPGAGAVYCPQLSQTMVRGARDRTTVPPAQVTELQKFISDYYDVDPDDIVTGYFGALTHGHVVRFQREQNLPAFGIVGPLTRAAIARVCGDNPPPAAQSCNFNGKTIADGMSFTAYASSTVAYGGQCKSETRTCIKGVLTGSYQQPSCSVSNPNPAENNNCSFNGQTIPNGSSVVAYQTSSAVPGGACVSERRYCILGFLTGSFAHATCTPRPEEPNNVGVPAPTLSFSSKDAMVVTGKRTTLTWVSTNATWCSAGGGWSGTKATSGSEVTATLWGTTTFTLTCFGPGGLTPVSKSATVAVIPEEPPQKRSCIQDGITLAHGTSRIFYNTRTANSASSCTAASELRTCNDGSLSGSFSYAYATCAPQPESMSLLPVISFSANPVSIAPGQRTTLTWVSTNATWCSAGGGWSGTKATSGSEVTATLWGTTTFTLTCFGPGGLTPVSKSATVAVIPEEPPQKRSCIQDGITLAHGTSRIFYSTRTAQNTAACTAASELRTCNDGTLSGSFAYASCTPNPGDSLFQGCSFNGQTIADGASITAYASSTVAYGGQCKSETRTCFRGVLTGSYGNATCTVGTTPPSGPLTDANCEPLAEGSMSIRPTTGPAPLAVILSWHMMQYYQWTGFDFGDGTKLDLMWGSPLVHLNGTNYMCTRHTYVTPGTYTIKQTLNGAPLGGYGQTVTVY